MSKLWSFQKPTEPGLYHLNFGDVVTRDSLEYDDFHIDANGVLKDSEHCLVANYHLKWKFLKIDIKELNDRGNVNEP